MRLSDEDFAVWEGFLRVHAHVTRALDAELQAAEGLTLSDYDVLYQLVRAPERERRMSELAGAVLASPSGLTRRVERLEREGLVERVRCDDDARGTLARLTETGYRRLRSATAAHLMGVRLHFLTLLGPDEKRLLGDAWKRILAEGSLGR